MKNKLIFPIICTVIILILLFCGCDYFGADDVYIPIYQDAIYIMDADGSNKQKVIDVDNCDNVQFIQDSNKLLYRADNSLFTVNEDGTENTKISGDLLVIDKVKPSISYNGEYITFNVQEGNNREVYIIELSNGIITNISNTVFFDEYCPKFSKSENLVCYSSNSADIGMIINVEYESMNKDTLYISNYNLGDVCYSINSNKVYFTQRSNRALAQLKRIDRETLITEVVTNNISFWNGGYFDINNYYYVILQFNSGDWIVNELDSKDTIILGNIPFPNLSSSNSAIYSSDYDTSSNINFHNLLTNSIEIIMDNGKAPAFSENDSLIVYVGRYLTNPKRNLITN